VVKNLKFNIDSELKKAAQYHQSGQLERAERIYKKILKINPNHSVSLFLLGAIAHQVGKTDITVNLINKAIQNDPKNPIYYASLGDVFLDQGKLNEAISCYQKALQLRPDYAEAYNNMGNAFKNQGKLNEAISCYQKALQLRPDFAEAYNSMGNASEDQGMLNEAISCYQKAVKLKPNLSEAYTNLVYTLQQTCAWQKLEGLTAKLDRLTKKALDEGTRIGESPFISLTKYADLSRNFAIAKSWSSDIARFMSNLKVHFLFDDRRSCKPKITVGYLSNDFRDHATAHLMLSLFGLHNRGEFEIFCYSYGEDDGSYYRMRIKQDCDKFVDLRNLSHADAAKCIYEDQVDILVDLKGHTKGNNDYTQTISNKDFKKADFGLPEDSFIFSSFNHPYKIDPVMFDIWMKTLRQVPQSVLWLQWGNETAEKNLKREAEAGGVKSERIIFAERLPKDEHLARLMFADLALDTRIVNGHTTTSDALWAGVPVITIQGSHFASRVSSSILTAIGLSELLTHTLKEYEVLAVRLARNRKELDGIRQRLDKNRLVAPLFDTPRFVKNLETAYKEMWKIFLAGETPRQIEILES